MIFLKFTRSYRGRLLPENDMPGEETVFSPLHPERGTTVLRFPGSRFSLMPALANSPVSSCSMMVVVVVMACRSLQWQMRSEQQAWVHIQYLQAGGWGVGRYSDLIQLPAKWLRCEKPPLLANGKLYLICISQYILGIDVASMTSSCIRLPNGVEFGYDPNFALSRAEGSGFCLVYVRKFQMQVWRYSMDYSQPVRWLGSSGWAGSSDFQPTHPALALDTTGRLSSSQFKFEFKKLMALQPSWRQSTVPPYNYLHSSQV
jgi:hypothetical protein